MSILDTPKMSMKFFPYDKVDRVFTAEISTLQVNGFRLGPVYDDALDPGFTLVNEETGREFKMVQVHVRIEDGDILWYEYEPVLKEDRIPWNIRIIIYND